MTKLPETVKRIHISLFKSKLQALELIARANHITTSGLLRIIIDSFIESQQELLARLKAYEHEELEKRKKTHSPQHSITQHLDF